MYNEDMIAIEGYINFCKDFDSDDESEKMKAYETYNNYFDVLDGCFEAFTIDEGKFSIATELFGGKNPFRMILDAIQAAWNWFIKKMGQLKDMLFRKKKKDDGNGNNNSSQSTDSTADVEELTKQLEELKRQKEEDNKELERLTKEMEKSVNDMTELRKDKKKALYSKDMELKLKNRELDKQKEENAKNQEEIDKLNSRNNRLKSALSKTKGNLDRSRFMADVYKSNIEDLRDRIDNADSRILRLKKALSKTKGNLDRSRFKVGVYKDDSDLTYKIIGRDNINKSFITYINSCASAMRGASSTLKMKIKDSKVPIDDLADGVSEENIKRINFFTNPILDHDKNVEDIDGYIKLIKDLQNDKRFYYLDNGMAAYQDKIKKFIDDTVKEVETSKNELKNYVESIEKKRIEKNEHIIRKILDALQNDYLILQKTALNISSAFIYKYDALTIVR